LPALFAAIATEPSSNNASGTAFFACELEDKSGRRKAKRHLFALGLKLGIDYPDRLGAFSLRSHLEAGQVLPLVGKWFCGNIPAKGFGVC